VYEFGYCEALLPVVRSHAGNRAVAAIGIRAGVRHGLINGAMQTAWQAVADGTPYAGATTRLEPDRMDAACATCSHRYRTDDPLSKCPACGAMGARLSGGDEFALAWLSYADGSPSETPSAQIHVAPVHRDSTVQQEMPGAP
jgi:Zn finger protein HypA/HybF involved in hydrogenase expression